MRIGFDAKRAFNNTSGLGNYSRFLITGLLRLFPEEKYYLYTPKISDTFNRFYGLAAQAHLRQPQGIANLLPGFWRSVGLSGILSKDRVKLFHGLSNELPYNISREIKTVVTMHDLIFIRYPELYKPIDRLIYHQKFKYACHKANKIIAISQQTKLDIEHYFKICPEKIEVVYQDCNPLFHQKAPADDLTRIKQKYTLPDKFILCVGTLEPRKNQLQLLKAWQQAQLTHDLPLVFIGRHTPYIQELKQFIQANQLTNGVIFLPYIPTAELPAIYQLASLFVYPSVFEGFGIPVLEALNSGVPVITSKGSCFAEAGGPATLYTSPHKVDELAQALQTITSDANLRQQMIQTGLEYAQQFRPEKTIRQVHQIYQELLR